MSEKKLYALIDGLTQDIYFVYKGVEGAICPFSRTNIAVGYGDQDKTFTSIEDVMSEPFICGKPLREICESIEFE